MAEQDSIILAEISKGGPRIIFEKSAGIPHYAASLAKVFLAAELLRGIDSNNIKNKEVIVAKHDLEGIGTDVLFDIVENDNEIKIDAITLMSLMIKYSCNSSTLILAKKFLPERKILEDNAKKIWGLKNVTLVGKDGEIANEFSLMDFLHLFKRIYEIKGKNWDLLREKLRTSRNIYYLFDQLELKVLGAKSGTKKLGDVYWINDCGVFERNGKMYFMGAMVSSRKISEAVKRIREIGGELVKSLS